ncbi:MAG: O-antigen ligase family protein [Candidatus Omnitrophica bacterium]|nr:O-antigen ligase family protein [Candidatus Omnitrophota bacterium]
MKALEKIAYFSIIGVAFFLPLASGVVNTLIGAGIIAWLVQKVIKKEITVRPTAANLPLVLFFVICCISIFNSIEPKTSGQGLIKVLKYLGIYFLLVENITSLKQLKNIITALVLGALVVCVDGLIQYAVGKDPIYSHPLMRDVGIKRMTATYWHCNDFGIYLVTVVGVIWALALYEFKKRVKWVWFFAAALVTFCTVLTFSRGAALAFFGSTLVMGLVKKDKLVLGLLVAVLIVAPFLIPSSAREWINTTKSPIEAFCNLDRIAFYKSAIQMIKDHPIIGVGVNTFMKAYPKYKVHDVDIITADQCYAHNNYLQMTGEIGLIGLGIFFWILAALFLEIRERCQTPSMHKIGEVSDTFVKNTALGLGCGIIAFLLNGLTESSFYFSKLVVVFWFMAGLAASLKFIKND